MARKVEVRPAPGKGLGVFAIAPIGAGEDIERCPVLVVDDATEAERIAEGALAHHLWDWDGGRVAIALGYGSLYNHGPEPCATVDADADALVFTAARDIAPGEEITIDYTNGGELGLWFDCA